MRRSTIIGALLAGGLALAGCSPDEDPSEQPPVPGTPPPPSEQASGGGEAPEVIGSSAHSGTDQEFAQQLIAHHEQLVEVAGLAEQNGQDPQIKELAAGVAQAERADLREIEQQLARIAGGQYASAPEDAATGMDANAPGLLQPAELDRLRQVEGVEFDTGWRQAVLTLQEGTLEAAKTELEEGTNQEMLQLAEKIVDEQPAEIGKVQAV